MTTTGQDENAFRMVFARPYRWVRHPFYVAAALLVVSSVLLIQSWVLAIAGTVLLLMLPIRTATEERHLLTRFGAEYRAYAERTGKFIPRCRR